MIILNECISVKSVSDANVVDVCELPCHCRKPNPCPLQDHQVLLTAQPPLHLHMFIQFGDDPGGNGWQVVFGL